MTTPHDPQGGPPRDPRQSDLEDQLRLSLARHAAQSPTDDVAGLVAERILHAVDRQAVDRRGAAAPRRRIRWAAPLAAAAVLIVLAGVVLAITRFGSDNRSPVAASPDRTVSGSRSVPPTPTPTARHTASPTTTPTATPSSIVVGPVDHPTLTGVRITDLTFDQTDDGWALATADCEDGSGNRCTALLHTSDGTDWQSRGGSLGFNVPGVTVGCSTKCVSHIRFANPTDGYAYGPSAFFMTTDGGTNWVQQPGGAQALETVNGNVIRVTGTDGGCAGPCDIGVQTADIGGTTWTDRDLGRSANAGADAVTLARDSSDAYVLVTGHIAGGASSATSTLYRSTDNGSTWSTVGEPCVQNGGASGEVDSVAVAAAPDGRVAALCRARQSPYRTVVDLSTDQGRTFHAQSGEVPTSTTSTTTQLTGDATTVLLTAGDGLARSTDAGKTWQRSPQVVGTVTFVGFESTTVGRAVTGGNTIWTTRDGGSTWSASRFD